MKTTHALLAGAFAAGLTMSASAVTANAFNNGGFETAGVGAPFENWVAGGSSGYSGSTDARTGSFALELAAPAFGSSVALQNSVADGGQPDLTPGELATLSFWAKGDAGGTGNVLYALRFLDSIGNILLDSGNQFFQADINTNDYTEIVSDQFEIPEGANAAFLEISQSIGPIGTGPAGEDWNAGLVLIDDVVLEVVSDGLPADLSGDGDVDDEDLGLFFSAFTGPDLSQGPLTNPAADLSGDGDVDDEDLGGAFGQFTGPLGPASVPEPTSLALLGLGGLLVARRRR